MGCTIHLPFLLRFGSEWGEGTSDIPPLCINHWYAYMCSEICPGSVRVQLSILLYTIWFHFYLFQASCSWDGTVRLWDLSCPTTGGHSTVTMREHPDAVYDLTATPSDPNLLISCGRKGSLVLWDLRSQGMTNRCICG